MESVALAQIMESWRGQCQLAYRILRQFLQTIKDL